MWKRRAVRVAAWLGGVLLALILIVAAKRWISSEPTTAGIVATLIAGVSSAAMGLGQVSNRGKAVLFAATLAGYVVIFIALTTLERQNKNVEAQRQVAEAQSQESLRAIQKSTEEAGRIQARNTELQERLLAMSREIANLGQVGIRTTTGGDSFAYIHTMVFSDTVYLSVDHIGKYPLYEVKVILYDQAWPEGSPPHAKFSTLREFPVIAPRASYPLHGDAWGVAPGGPVLVNQDQAYFVAQFSARNGGWGQQVRLRKVGEQWQVATQVRKRTGRVNKVLLELADPGFPRTRGKIMW
jgi:hypothetical protein